MLDVMTPVFRTTRRVEFCETDMAGIVHFANFFRYMEQAEHEFFRSLGLKIAGTLADGRKYGWPRVNATCSYQSPAFYEDLIDVRIFVERKSERSLTLSYEFSREGITLAKGEMKTVFCIFPEGERMQAISMPPEIAAPLEKASGG